MLFGAIVCVIVLAGGFLISMPGQQETPIVEQGAETNADIVPASGPSGSTAASEQTGDAPTAQGTKDWGSAPELASPQAASQPSD